METRITGKEYPLKQIFSKEFDYYIPPYQRPYAWSTEEAGTLFNDLYDFFSEEKNDNFFLGSIVLMKKEENKAEVDVIDGQQRLTTLTILLAVIAKCLSDSDAQKSCLDYLREPGNKLEKLEAKPRLHLRERDQDFFNKYIQNIKLDDLVKLDIKSLKDESQQHIKENCELFINKIETVFHNDEDKITEFCIFLMTRCYIVSVCAPNEQSAFRVFSVMNSRGMDLLPIDIIKSNIIGQIPDKEQQLYTDKWEELEVQTTRAGFNDLFAHIRMIFAKSKAKQNLLDEFTEAVLKKTTPKELIDKYLEPYAEAYSILNKKNYESTKHAEEVNRYLFWLNKVENSDWMPSAIKFMAEHKNDSEYVLWFVKKLERLSSYLYITAKDVNFRIERYKSILEEMEINPDHCIDDLLVSIELTNKEKQEFVNALNGDIYLLTGKRRNFVILRLNAFVSDGANKFDYEPNILTIEHVLPQTVEKGSQWDELWTDLDTRHQWLNKIANLVPLTRKKNSAAQNYDFDKKKNTYFKGKDGTTSYPLTTQVLCENEWTPEVVKKRQDALIKRFVDCWELVFFKSVDQNHTQTDAESTIFYITDKRGANAKGYSTATGFIVTADSKLSDNIVDNFNANYPNAYKLRQKLLEDKIVIDCVFQDDYEFDSISLAASIILGRNASGPKEWTNKDGLRFEETIDKLNINGGKFNINDESTYGYLTTGSLAYELFRHIFELGNITLEEIEKLKTKEYTKQLFNQTDYPVLADHRDDNMGNSTHIRYRKNPLNFKGENIYITTQWFIGNRDDVIDWFKNHL